MALASGGEAIPAAAPEPAAPPAAPWVESDRLEDHLARADVSPAWAQAARALAAEGLAVLDLEDPHVPGLCDAAIAETRAHYVDPAVNRVQDAWRASPAVRRLAASEEVVGFLRLAYGREPFPFQTLNFERGSQQHAHADTMHFHAEPPLFMCGVWLALEDVAEDAGPLLYYPGSHKLPVLSMRDVGVGSPRPRFADYVESYPDAIARLAAERGLEKRQALPRKGQALVWAANLLHGGEPIHRPGATRRSLVTHYYFDGCAYYTPMTSDVEAGRLSLRLPADIRDGRWRWPTRDGRPLWPGWKPIAGALRQSVQPRPIVFRDGD